MNLAAITDDCSAGFMMTVLPVTRAAVSCRRGSPAENSRGDDDRDAARFIEIFVVLAGRVAAWRHGQPEHFPGIVIAKIDRLGDVGVRFAPRFAALVAPPTRPVSTGMRMTRRP